MVHCTRVFLPRLRLRGIREPDACKTTHARHRARGLARHILRLQHAPPVRDKSVSWHSSRPRIQTKLCWRSSNSCLKQGISRGAKVTRRALCGCTSSAWRVRSESLTQSWRSVEKALPLPGRHAALWRRGGSGRHGRRIRREGHRPCGSESETRFCTHPAHGRGPGTFCLTLVACIPWCRG